MSIPLSFCWEVGIAKAAFRSIVRPMVPVIHMIPAVLLVIKVIVTGIALELRPTMARGIAMLVPSRPPSVKHAPACSTGGHGCNERASCTTRWRSLEQGSELVETTGRPAPLGRGKKELARYRRAEGRYLTPQEAGLKITHSVNTGTERDMMFTCSPRPSFPALLSRLTRHA